MNRVGEAGRVSQTTVSETPSGCLANEDCRAGGFEAREGIAQPAGLCGACGSVVPGIEIKYHGFAAQLFQAPPIEDVTIEDPEV